MGQGEGVDVEASGDDAQPDWVGAGGETVAAAAAACAGSGGA